ncbi:hypothetical protein X753_24170 [Mesorhizobium sp. LNJC399B00]|uniref:hypothetical protein n=1 Tax=unclassified Mesorhizobium TaxID=325217 RepID=UPI0003CE109C|nr:MULTISPECIES: hypothetical protein [unclassified Mesorhizobium]ESY03252.1 hypothetical protein X753_24170 [Mesorhizobium sp. LNJC399B00]WJI69393.1 hypothetical protein NLY36_00880 [Mesorhizobium sp. C399B]
MATGQALAASMVGDAPPAKTPDCTITQTPYIVSMSSKSMEVDMASIPDEDYKLLDLYVHKVLTRAGVTDDKKSEAVEDLMHPLTALIDSGADSQEFIPYIKLKLREWVGPNAGRT